MHENKLGEMTDAGDGNEKLPLLPLRGLLAYPNMVLKIDVGRGKSLTAIERALGADQRVLVVAQRDATVEDPHVEDVYGVGTVVKIKQVIRLPDDTVRLLVEGESRALLLGVVEQDDVQLGELKRIEPRLAGRTLRLEAAMRTLKTLFFEYAAERGGISGELTSTVEGEEDPGTLSDLIAANALKGIRDKQQMLETRSVRARLDALMGILAREIELIRMEKRIHTRVHEKLDQHQKEYYLNEQLRAIHEELGDDDESEKDKFEKRLKQSKMNAEARAQVERELKRYQHMPSGAPEASVSRNYIECMLELPWGTMTHDRYDLASARRILDKEHFGLEKVKERILEFLAVGAVKDDLKGPILCLVGPPGVGKTSIARSVAHALRRKFVRLSLGGLRDEAEIRGHRRTYIGAIPGRIVSGVRTSGSMNPVFLLDEIDKLASDFRGDPASALLEALDPEQNRAFSDHYLEAPLDLSSVLFITTANSLDTIPRALLDRMEVIELEGYTRAEKAEIALRHLWPKQLKAHGLSKAQVKLSRAALDELIDGYTRESGVRTLERTLATLCRKTAVKLSEGGTAPLSIAPKTVASLLGARKFSSEPPLKEPEQGVVNGLAWTPFGGETLSIEVAVMPGSGTVDLTGQLGDVMKESARAAYAYIRSRSETLGIAVDFHKTHDLHIHVPEGATPKDGPSAGVAMTCAMVSAITGRKARQDVAMTGEITLVGKVLPIGGVKEKLLAAHRMGIGTVLLPGANEKDLEDVPSDVRSKMNINLIARIDQALNLVLTN